MRTATFLMVFPVALASFYFSHILPFAPFHYAIALGLVVLSGISPKKASLLFMVTVIVIDDFSKSYEVQSGAQTGFVSLFNITVAGQTLYLLLAIYFVLINLGILLLQEKQRTGHSLVIGKISPEMRVLLAVGTVSALIGLPNLTHGARAYVSDLGFFINIILGYIIVRASSRNLSELDYCFKLFIFAVMAKVVVVLIDVAYFSLGKGLITIKPGSDSYLVPAVVLYCLMMLREYGISRADKFLGSSAMTAAALAYFVVTAARGRLIGGLIALGLFLYALKFRRGLMGVAFAVALISFTLPLIPPEYLAYLQWKVRSFEASADTGHSALVRLVSLKNILAQQLATVYQIVVGTGLGGYFTSEYYQFPMALRDSDFPHQWVVSDQFYKPHGSLLFLLLKTGMVGLILVYGKIVLENIKLLNFIRNTSSIPADARRILFVSAPLILPSMLVNFTSKLQFSTGLLLAFVYFGKNLLDEFSVERKAELRKDRRICR